MAMARLFWLAAGAGLVLLLHAGPARAQQQRFDIQPWRPTPGPRDLLIVPQTQPLTNFTFAGGAYLSFALDPLALVNRDGQRAYDVVRNRLELDLMAAIGWASGSSSAR